jgi:hypothetical protein
MATASFCYPNRCSAHATISSQNMPTAHAKGPSGCLRRLRRITTAVPHIAKTRISAKPTKLQKRTGLFSPLHIPNRRPRERPHRRPFNPIRPHVCVEMVTPKRRADQHPLDRSSSRNNSPSVQAPHMWSLNLIWSGLISQLLGTHLLGAGHRRPPRRGTDCSLTRRRPA